MIEFALIFLNILWMFTYLSQLRRIKFWKEGYEIAWNHSQNMFDSASRAHERLREAYRAGYVVDKLPEAPQPLEEPK